MTAIIRKLSRSITCLITIASIGILTACGGGGTDIAGPQFNSDRAKAPAQNPEQGSTAIDPREQADIDETYDSKTGEVIQ